MQYQNDATEVRVRVNQPIRIRLLDGSEITGEIVKKDELQSIVGKLTGDSLYACENELKQGYFTAAGGYRVGICGKLNAGDHFVQNVGNIASICVRIPREITGCAESLYKRMKSNGVGGVIILSAPGIGKTTLLRDLIRILSENGYNVGVVDERREIAACEDGVPQMNVGSRTDIADGCPKHIALSMVLRSCAPDFLAVDEISGTGDADALLDTCRCGVFVIATAHANCLEDAYQRRGIGDLLKCGIFKYVVQLGPEKGMIREIAEFRNGEVTHDENCISFIDTNRHYRCRETTGECKKATP